MTHRPTPKRPAVDTKCGADTLGPAVSDSVAKDGRAVERLPRRRPDEGQQIIDVERMAGAREHRQDLIGLPSPCLPPRLGGELGYAYLDLSAVLIGDVNLADTRPRPFS